MLSCTYIVCLVYYYSYMFRLQIAAIFRELQILRHVQRAIQCAKYKKIYTLVSWMFTIIKIALKFITQMNY